MLGAYQGMAGFGNVLIHEYARDRTGAPNIGLKL